MINLVDARKGAKHDIFARLSGRNRLERENVMETVSEIIKNVKSYGDQAVFEYTRKFDAADLGPSTVQASPREIQEAYEKIDRSVLEVIRRAKANIEKFHLRQKENSWFCTEDNGVILGQLYMPLEAVGVYVPGGTAALTSSVLMNVIPARIAEVEKIIVTTPPRRDGSISPGVLVAANEAGASAVYKIGGAQAIAALAFGTETIPRVDKIVGPGNIYVSTAKRMVFGFCDIDMFAGPSEIAIIADESANPRFIAADLLSQAEHDVMAAAILVTTSERIAEEVRAEVERQYSYLPRKKIIASSLKDYGFAVIVNTLEEAVDIINKIAPEHLEIFVEEPFSLLGSVKNAGAIFIGPFSSEPVGDYFAGPNHVLPTGGTARFFSPLSVDDFIKKSSVISYTKRALADIKDDVARFAEFEGLAAHANAVRVRFE